MATIADVTVAGDALPLGGLLESSSGVSVEVERLVLLGDHVHPYFGVSGGSRECVEETLESQPSVASVERLADVEGRDLYRAGWTSEVDGFGAALLDADGSVLEGSGADGTWEFRLRFPDRERLRRFGDRCDESGLELELNGVYDPDVPPVEERLSAVQWRTLTTAYEMGFFEVPRKATLSELGERLGVSKQATSGRMRRAMREVVGAVIHGSSEASRSFRPPRD